LRRPGIDNLIFDIGMNVCEDTDFYLEKGFRVVAVEANPAACRNAAEKYHEVPISFASRLSRMTRISRATSPSKSISTAAANCSRGFANAAVAALR
jgi:hypothetical protein